MRDDAKNYVSQCRRLHGHRKVPTGMLRPGVQESLKPSSLNMHLYAAH